MRNFIIVEKRKSRTFFRGFYQTRRTLLSDFSWLKEHLILDKDAELLPLSIQIGKNGYGHIRPLTKEELE